MTFNEIITQTVHLLSANTTPEYYTCIYVSVNYMLSTNRHALRHLIADSILCMSHLVKTSHENHLCHICLNRTPVKRKEVKQVIIYLKSSDKLHQVKSPSV